MTFDDSPIPPGPSRPAHHASPAAHASGAAWHEDAAAPVVGASGAAWGSDESPAPAGTVSTPPETAHPFAAADRGRYRLGAELGIGGMGVVRSARDQRLNRDVAYKSIADGADPSCIVGERFVREARITAFLEHPAIVPIYDAGEDEAGEPFYTMRLIRGRSLSVAVAEAPDLLARLRLLRHFLDACEAVAYAHRQGVVHRDLKPDNVMVGEFGETQVVDWGLARWDGDVGDVGWASVTQRGSAQAGVAADAGSADRTPPQAADNDGTRAGSVVGTPAYMSPEQARGEPAGTRSDVWSLGVMLWQLVAGVHPLAGRTSEEVLRAVRDHALPSLSDRCAAAPPELCAIVAQAMATDQGQRYPDAKALADDVARYIDGRMVQAHLYSPWEPLRRLVVAYRAPLAVAGVALFALVATGLFAARRTQAQHDRAVLAEKTARGATATADQHLAQALVQHAQLALSVDARAEAEIFAIEALLRSESPEARGVLAGFGVAPRPHLIDRTPMPRCLEIRPSPAGDIFVCLQPDAVELWRVTPTGVHRLWRAATHAVDAVILQGQNQVLLTVARGQSQWLDQSTGHAIVGRDGLSTFDGVWETATAFGVALVYGPGTSHVLHSATTKLVSYLPCPNKDPLVAASLSHDARWVATVCASGQLVITDTTTGKTSRQATLVGMGEAVRGVTAIAWMPDDAALVVGGRDGTVALVDVGQLRVVRRARLGLGETREVRPHPTRAIVAVMGERGGVLLWGPRTGAVLGRLPAGWSETLRFSPDGLELWSYGSELRRWRLPDAPRPVRFWGLPDRPGLSAAQLSPDGKQLALLPGSGVVHIIRTADGQVLMKDKFQDMVLKGGQFSADGRTFLAYGVANPAIRLYDTASWRPTRTLAVIGRKRALLLNNGWLITAPYGRHLLAVSPQETDNGVNVADHLVIDTAITADGGTGFALSRLGHVDRIDVGAPPRVVPLFVDRSARRIGTDPDGKWLAVARRRDLVVLPTAGGPRTTIQMGDGLVYDVALSLGARYVAVGNLRRTARVWRVADRTLVAVLRGHSQRVSHVSFDRTGEQLLTASWDGTARLWDMRVLARPAAELAAEVQTAWGLSLRDALDTPFR